MSIEKQKQTKKIKKKEPYYIGKILVPEILRSKVERHVCVNKKCKKIFPRFKTSRDKLRVRHGIRMHRHITCCSKCSKEYWPQYTCEKANITRARVRTKRKKIKNNRGK